MVKQVFHLTYKMLSKWLEMGVGIRGDLGLERYIWEPQHTKIFQARY